MVIDSLSSGDRVQLLEVYARSVMLLELERYADWAKLFGSHAVVRYVGAHEQSPVEFKGREELMLLAERLRRGEFAWALGRVATSPVRVRHHLTNITLFGDGQGWALGYAFLTVESVRVTEPPLWLASGLYADRLFKNPTGCWCFAGRTLTDDQAVALARDSNHQRVATR